MYRRISMILKNIKTEGYRNLAGDVLELTDGINLLYGDNAAGKTNTLECAYVFACGKSFRARHESEIICKGKQTARAEICIQKNCLQNYEDGQNSSGDLENMSVVWHKSRERGYVKRMLYQGYEVSKASEFLGIFRAVLFTPDHLSLIKGSPEERRRFIDIALSQLQPRYVYFLNSYLKILSQKNSYLRIAASGGKTDNEYLDILNEQLAKAAAVLVKQRFGFVKKLREHAASFYGTLSESKELLDVKYVSATKNNFDDKDYTEQKLIEIYRQDKESELRQGKTIHGPHKDDLLIYIADNAWSDEQCVQDDENNVSMLAARTFGSQGQQRSAVLAIKLAEGEISKELTGEYPVFLLDDLLGELDEKRRNCLCTLIKDKQAIISCCDKTAIPKMNNIGTVRVADGKYFHE